jgi:hypothetical protein
MPQDSFAQGLVRQAFIKFPATPIDEDQPVMLSGLEIGAIRTAMVEFIRVPSERSPDDPPLPPAGLHIG